MADEDRGSPRKDPAPPKGNKGLAGDRELWRFVASGAQLGISVGVFVWIGWLLDQQFGTSPWLLIVMGMIGVAAGLYHFIKGALK